MASARISVVALGTWGTALANHLAQRGHAVVGWSHDPQCVASVNCAHRNSKCVSEVELHPALRATPQIEEALEAEVVIMAFPSSALGEIMPKLRMREGSILVSAIKGFEETTLLTPLQFAEKMWGARASYAVLSGPSFAKDIIRSNPAGVVAASKSEEVARQVADLFMGGSLRVYTSTDAVGVEVGGAVKNVIALAAGICDGLHLGDSARAGLITRGLAEMVRLALALGADARTLAGLSGLGDLVMTATCDTSRNRSAGLRLGRGEKLPAVLREIGTVVEGVHTTPLVLELAKRHNVEMPITAQMAKVLSGESSPADAVRALLTRPMRREIE